MDRRESRRGRGRAGDRVISLTQRRRWNGGSPVLVELRDQLVAAANRIERCEACGRYGDTDDTRFFQTTRGLVCGDCQEAT